MHPFWKMQILGWEVIGEDGCRRSSELWPLIDGVVLTADVDHRA